MSSLFNISSGIIAEEINARKAKLITIYSFVGIAIIYPGGNSIL